MLDIARSIRCACRSEKTNSPRSSIKLMKLCRLSPSIEARKRSEEHTSELQSLMRISYAVFCLKKKQRRNKKKRRRIKSHLRCDATNTRLTSSHRFAYEIPTSDRT